MRPAPAAPGYRFQPAWWLPNRHLQTFWGPVTRPRVAVVFERETIETPDGDLLHLDHLAGAPDTPRLVVFHGLEGSSYSVYVQGLMRLAAARRWRATVLNFRSCALDPKTVRRARPKHRPPALPNRRPRLYHSGETSDPDLVIRLLSAREPGVPLVAVGASLGGNVLLKWLGEHPGEPLLAAAVALSTPYDLGRGARHTELPAGRPYVLDFLRTLVPKVRAVLQRHPEVGACLDLEAVARARTFFAFDDAATAPLHGFAGADDYYTRSSSLRLLGKITTPTLCVSAVDDPFLPPEVLEEVRDAASPAVEPLFTEQGGHLGFVEGNLPWKASYWAETVAIDWIARRLGLPA